MVKNKTGGNKSKRMASKYVNAEPAPLRKRIVVGEMYASVVKLYGGQNCEVICEDGITRLCVIRKSFRGRNKRRNFLKPGVWILVGIRDWETEVAGKKQRCDCLSVYSESDKYKLQKVERADWSVLNSVTPSIAEVTGTLKDLYYGDIDTTLFDRSTKVVTASTAVAENSNTSLETIDDIDFDDI